MFSKSCHYGIRAIIWIAQNSLHKKRVNVKEIAEAIQSPEAYTAKILQQLSRSRILKAQKGPTGGFYMDEKMLENLMLNKVVDAIDGDISYTGCGLGLETCSDENPCPLHSQFVSIKSELKQMLECTSIKSLALGVDNGETFLKNLID